MTHRTSNEDKARRARLDFRSAPRREPTKTELRQELAQIAANTQKSADASVAVRMERQQRERGG